MVLRYGVAVLTVELALLLKFLLDPFIAQETSPFLLFFGPVMVSAWYGGLAAGVLATALAALSANYFFLFPLDASFNRNIAELVQLSLFLLEGVLVTVLTYALRSAKQRAERSSERALRHEETLCQSEERYRLLVEGVQDYAIFTLDPAGCVASWNAGAGRIFGYRVDEVAGRHFSFFYPEEERAVESPDEELVTAERDGRLQATVSCVRKGGTRFWADTVITSLKDDSGRLRGFSKVIRDVTERKRAEEELRESEIRFKLAARATNDAIWDWNLENDAVWWNEGVGALFGFSLDEVGGDVGWWLAHIHPEDRERVNSGIHAVIDGREPFWRDEYRFCRADGSYAFVYDRGYLMYDAEKKPIRMVGAMLDATERKRVEVERQKLVSLVENSSDFIAIWSLEGKTLFVNRAGRALIGLDGSDAVGTKSMFDYVSEEDQPELRERILPSVLKRGGWEGEFRLRNVKSGVDTPVQMNVFAIALDDERSGQPIAIANVSRDITERKRVEEERARFLAREREARREAEAANRMKDEFLTTLSHELRTPLTSILGWAQLLRKGDLDETTTARGLELIERAAILQAKLIEDLLDISRIITGKLRTEVRPVRLAPVIDAAIEVVRPAAEAKDIRLESRLDPLAGAVSGDPDRLQQVVWNLLSNAIKFTPKKGRVEVRLERAGSHARIAVSDTGQGIEPQFLPYVFERFRQADASTTRGHGGLGLGLAIVRQLVELHGGMVHAQSAGAGRGSTFAVELPMSPVGDGERASQGPVPAVAAGLGPGESAALEGVRMLVVDDEPDARELLTVVLQRYGAEVTAVASAGEALAALARSPLDVLVSDIGMPGEDGYALIRKVRALDVDQGGGIPAAALTAYAREEDRRRALSAGFQMHVSKPIEPIQLASVVAALAGRA